MRTPGRVATIVVMLAVLAGACSSSSESSTTTTTSGPPASFAELESRIISKVPSGFVEQPSEAFDTGPSDLAKAIRDDGDPNAARILRSEKFVRGYQRIWIGPEHAQIIVFIDQFHAPAGARRDFARTTREFNSKPPPGAYRFVIPGLPAERAVGVTATDKDGAGAFVYFSTGVFNVQINCNGPRPDGLQPRVVAIAKDQYRRL